jgi:hypothetical protein
MEQHEHAFGEQFWEEHLDRWILLGQELGEGVDVGGGQAVRREVEPWQDGHALAAHAVAAK